jgi:hypothetical protein
VLLLLLALQDVAGAVRDLSSDDLDVRARAVETLSKAGVAAAAPVAELLEAADEELAGRAETILRSIGLSARAAVKARSGDRARRLERALILDKAKSLVLEGTRFKIDWGEPPAADPATTLLDVASGDLEAGPTTWLRFVPVKGSVDVLRLELDAGALKVSRATLATAAYDDLISVIAAIGEGQLHDELKREHLGEKSVWRRVSTETDGVLGVDLEYGGRCGTTFAGKLARPRGAAAMAFDAIKPLVFKESSLEARDRAAVSARLNRAWKWIESAQFFGWIRVRSLQLVGLAGDASALPLLRAIVACADAKSPELAAAVAAAARLLSITPPEDLEAARRRILDAIPK